MNFDINIFSKNLKKLLKQLKSEQNLNYSKNINKAKNYFNSGEPFYFYHSNKFYLYILLSKALIDGNHISYDLAEGARIIPIIYNLSLKWDTFLKIKNSNLKLAHLCSNKNDNVDATIFEILIGIKYIDLGYSVEFIKETPQKKTPDLLITKNNKRRFIECKKMQQGNLYTHDEIKRWNQICDILSKVVTQYELRGHLQITFFEELKKINPKRILRKVRNKISVCERISTPFHIVKNKEFKIQFTPISPSKFHVKMDPLRKKNGPSFINYLIKSYDPECLYKCLSDPKEVINSFVGELNWAAILSFKFSTYKSTNHKSQHIKRKLVEATNQLAYSPGDAHILVEEYNGLDVYLERLLKNFKVMHNFEDKNKSLQRVYIHYLKYGLPLNILFDIEETVTSFAASGFTPEDMVSTCFPAETCGDGFGELLYEQHFS